MHRIADPSLLLKIAADEYPELRILATGSSTLAATGKFRDSLTGRKRAIYLCPVLWEECEEPFGIADLDRRLLLRWSTGQVDYSRLSRLTELSRPTVKSCLEALEIAHAVHLLRPFRGGGGGEIVSRPKCYAFDTGFVTFGVGGSSW